MDSALNNLERLISHKIQPTNQPTNQTKSFIHAIMCDSAQTCFEGKIN